jgi:Glycosyl hydrolase family 57
VSPVGEKPSPSDRLDWLAGLKVHHQRWPRLARNGNVKRYLPNEAPPIHEFQAVDTCGKPAAESEFLDRPHSSGDSAQLGLMDRRTFLSSCFASLAASALPAAAQTEPQYLLTYDHGGLILWGIPEFVTNLRWAVEWLDRYPGFAIGLENEAYTYDYLAEHDPAVLDEVRGYLQKYQGRFGIGTCTYGQPLSTYINEESNIRQIHYAQQANRKHFGVTPAIYLMSEHAMHAQIPQILAGFGFYGAIMRTHYMMYGYNPTFDVSVGLWTGADDTRIWAVPTYPGEGAAFGKTTIDDWILTRCPGPQCGGNSLEDFARKFAHIHPLIATRADDAPLRREELVKETEGNRRYRWLLLEDLLSAFPLPTQELKTQPNDFKTRMPWGYCGNEIWIGCRKAEMAVLLAERLASFEFLAGGGSRDAQLETAWKELLISQHHDVQICGLLPDARRHLGASLRASQRAQGSALEFIAGKMKSAGPVQITVCNPHSWVYDGWIEAEFAAPRGWTSQLEAVHEGRQVPTWLVLPLRASGNAIRGGTVAIRVQLPPLSVSTFSLAAAREPKRVEVPTINPCRLSIENANWVCRLHPEGGFAALESRLSRKPLFQPGKRSGFFAATINGRKEESRGQWHFPPGQEGSPRTAAVETGLIGSIPYRMELEVWNGSPRLDFRVRFDFEGQRIGAVTDDPRDSTSAFVHEEKLRFKMFPAVGRSAVGVRDLPFVISETQETYVNGIYWAAVSDDHVGLAIFNRGSMGSVRESDGGFAAPLAFANSYIWGTRMLSGEFVYEFSLWPFEGPWQDATLHRHALEYNLPCSAVGSGPGDGEFGETLRPVSLSSDDVAVSAFYPHAGHVYLRLFEHKGHSSVVPLQAWKDQPLTEVNLAEDVLAVAPSSIAFRPWQVRTFRMS